jgi:hypothetical protein
MNWVISCLECKPVEGDLQNVVVTAHWRCNGEMVDGDKTYSGSVYGSCGFGEPGIPFTEYENLTLEQVLGWVWEKLDKEATEASVQGQLDAQAYPPVVRPPLPWA